MKITKYILLLLLLISVAFVVFIATQPNDYEISREKEISTSKENIFNYVNDFSTWEEWFSLKEFDSKTVIKYSSNTNDLDAGLSWNSPTSFGKIKTTQTKQKDSIKQNFYINDDVHKITWVFIETPKGTKVKWSMKGKLSFKWKLNSILQNGMDDVYGTIFENGINKIEKYLVSELKSMKITHQGIVTKHAANFIQQIDSCTIDDFQSKSKNMLQSMIQFVEDNEIELKGLPFVMVDKYDESKNYIKFAMCVPVEEQILTTEGSQISGNHFDEFTAFKTTLIGDYKHLKKARNKSIEEIEKLGYVIDKKNKYIEIYKESLPKIKNPSKWVTELYFPVRRKIVTPIISNTDTTSTKNINVQVE